MIGQGTWAALQNTVPATSLDSCWCTPAPIETFARSIVRNAAAQTIDGDEDRGPFKHLHQPVE